ncbi:hypothetical protein [Inhella sp.]|uniref:hypothetical protein n=1 Tax=Inhella sp. TaxID=1921806 RepID=UPI0035AD9AB4
MRLWTDFARLRAAGWIAALMVGLAWPLAAHTTESDPYVVQVLGRADTDASGGWWVALWVIDGDRSHFVVSAPRSELGELPDAQWAPADAPALLILERFGAPKLIATRDVALCPTELRWGQALPSLRWDWPVHHVQLQHPTCSSDRCGPRQAWRIELPPHGGDTLPLARLLPGLAAQGSQWLALHVATVHPRPTLSELRTLVAPPTWAGASGGGGELALMASTARHFPAIHEAMLLHAARTQHLDAASAVMLEGPTAVLRPIMHGPHLPLDGEQRAALGLDSGSLMERGGLHRMLLRLLPHDRPSRLSLASRQVRSTSPARDWRALVPDPQDLASCRARLKTFKCAAACAERVSHLPRLAVDGDLIARMTLRERQSACVKSCEKQKAGLRANLVRTHEASQHRQAQAWQRVEALTGRSAADWQREP